MLVKEDTANKSKKKTLNIYFAKFQYKRKDYMTRKLYDITHNTLYQYQALIRQDSVK